MKMDVLKSSIKIDKNISVNKVPKFGQCSNITVQFFSWSHKKLDGLSSLNVNQQSLQDK